MEVSSRRPAGADDRRSASGSGSGLGYFPALDGLRAVALLTVLGFHADVSWIHGGYLPLTSFFVLSGFLITALLLGEHHHAGRVDLRRFWGRRARRLAPGAVLGIALAASYVGLTEKPTPGFQGDAIASVGWLVNWRFILSGRSYEAAFAEPSPLQHYWSLAVEEQFYLVMPLLAFALLALGRGRRRYLAIAAAALAGVSTVTMAVLHHPGDPPLRVYFGTDTRAAEIFVGVLLATALVRNGAIRQLTGARRAAVDVAGAAALVVSGALWIRTPEYDDRLYEGGLLGIALLAALVVVAATQPGTVVARLLGLRPIAAIGRLSYGLYLYHWPLFLWLSPERTGLPTAPLFAVRMAATTAIALLSYHLVERPIRRGALPGRIGPIAWANGTVTAVALAAVVAAVVPTQAVITLGDQEATLPAPVTTLASTTTTTVATTTTAPVATTTAAPAPAPGPAVERPRTPAPPTTEPPPPPTTETPTTLPPPLRVMVLGDSIGRNLAFGLQQWAQGGAVAVIDDATVPGCPAEGGGVRFRADGVEWPVPEDCSWWMSGARARLEAFAPDVVVVATGLNELYLRSHPSWEGNRALGDPVYDDRLHAAYLQLIDAFTSTGARMVWLEPPCVRYYSRHYDPADGALRMAALRGIMASATAARGVPELALDEPICPGGYSDVVLGIPGARPDGYHLIDPASVAVTEQWLGPHLLAAAGR